MLTLLPIAMPPFHTQYYNIYKCNIFALFDMFDRFNWKADEIADFMIIICLLHIG